MLGILYSQHYVEWPHDYIAAGEYALPGGLAVFVNLNQAALVDFYAGGGADNLVLWYLAHCHDGAVCRAKLCALCYQIAVLIVGGVYHQRSFRGDFHRRLAELEYYAISLGIFELLHAG